MTLTLAEQRALITPRTFLRHDAAGAYPILRAVLSVPRPGRPSFTPATLREAHMAVRGGSFRSVGCTAR